MTLGPGTPGCPKCMSGLAGGGGGATRGSCPTPIRFWARPGPRGEQPCQAWFCGSVCHLRAGGGPGAPRSSALGGLPGSAPAGVALPRTPPQARASVSSPPPRPLPGSDAVLSHSPWELAPKGRAATLLQPCMARVLYLAAEKGRVEPLGESRRAGMATPLGRTPSPQPPSTRRQERTPHSTGGGSRGHPEKPGHVPTAPELEMAEPSEPGPQGALEWPGLPGSTAAAPGSSEGRAGAVRGQAGTGAEPGQEPRCLPLQEAPFLGEGGGCPPLGSWSPPRGLLGTQSTARGPGISAPRLLAPPPPSTPLWDPRGPPRRRPG